MPVTDDQVANLRTVALHDFEAHDRLVARMDQESGWDGYTALIGAGFFEAVERRFAKPGVKHADVIRWVGEARARFDPNTQKVDPTVAERLILFSLGHGEIDDIDDGIVMEVQTIVLIALLEDAKYDEVQLDAFLTEARALADEWLAADA